MLGYCFGDYGSLAYYSWYMGGAEEYPPFLAVVLPVQRLPRDRVRLRWAPSSKRNGGTIRYRVRVYTDRERTHPIFDEATTGITLDWRVPEPEPAVLLRRHRDRRSRRQESRHLVSGVAGRVCTRAAGSVRLVRDDLMMNSAVAVLTGVIMLAQSAADVGVTRPGHRAGLVGTSGGLRVVHAGRPAVRRLLRRGTPHDRSPRENWIRSNGRARSCRKR